MAIGRRLWAHFIIAVCVDRKFGLWLKGQDINNQWMAPLDTIKAKQTWMACTTSLLQRNDQSSAYSLWIEFEQGQIKKKDAQSSGYGWILRKISWQDTQLDGDVGDQQWEIYFCVASLRLKWAVRLDHLVAWISSSNQGRCFWAH